MPYLKYKEDKLIYMPTNTGEIFTIDLNLPDIERHSVNFNLSKAAKKYRDNVLLERNPLLFEERCKFDINML